VRALALALLISSGAGAPASAHESDRYNMGCLVDSVIGSSTIVYPPFSPSTVPICISVPVKRVCDLFCEHSETISQKRSNFWVTQLVDSLRALRARSVFDE